MPFVKYSFTLFFYLLLCNFWYNHDNRDYVSCCNKPEQNKHFEEVTKVLSLPLVPKRRGVENHFPTGILQKNLHHICMHKIIILQKKFFLIIKKIK